MVHKHEDLHTAGISVDELCDSEDVVAMHNMVSMYQIKSLVRYVYTWPTIIGKLWSMLNLLQKLMANLHTCK